MDGFGFVNGVSPWVRKGGCVHLSVSDERRFTNDASYTSAVPGGLSMSSTS